MVERIRELCEEQGKTLFSLEKECGFGNGTINKWDKNSPSIDRVVLVAKALNTTVSYLIGETDEKSPPPFLEADSFYFFANAAATVASSCLVTKP